MRTHLALIALATLGLTATAQAAEKELQARVIVAPEGQPITIQISEDGQVVQDNAKPAPPPPPGAPATPGTRVDRPLVYRLDALNNELHNVVTGPGGLIFGEASNATFLGVDTSEAPEILQHQLKMKPEGSGLVVNAVIPGSPAEKAGLKRFDVLQKVDDQILFNTAQLSSLVHSMKAGDQAKLTIIRGGDAQTVNATLGKQDAPRFSIAIPAEGGEIRAGGGFGLKGNAGPWVGGKQPVNVPTRSTFQAWIVDGVVYNVTTSDGHKRLTVQRDGKQVLDVPIDTEEQMAKLPKEIAQQLKKQPQLTAPPIDPGTKPIETKPKSERPAGWPGNLGQPGDSPDPKKGTPVKDGK